MLKIDNLRVSYGHIEVLKGISFSVEMGEIVALIGGNGAGKTTTLSTISGLVRPTSGTITWKGEHIQTAAVEAIVGSGLAHCPEGRRIFPGLTVLENLLVYAKDQPAERLRGLVTRRATIARQESLLESRAREILALTARPEVISFAGGLPAPELFDVDGIRAAYEAPQRVLQ